MFSSQKRKNGFGCNSLPLMSQDHVDHSQPDLQMDGNIQNFRE